MYKVAFPVALFTRGKFYYEGKIGYFPGVNSTTGKLHSHFFRGGGGGGEGDAGGGEREEMGI